MLGSMRGLLYQNIISTSTPIFRNSGKDLDCTTVSFDESVWYFKESSSSHLRKLLESSLSSISS